VALSVRAPAAQHTRTSAEGNEMMEQQPKVITLANLEVLVMPNGEVICIGKTLGWFNELHKYLTAILEKQ
jgi:hypothetical protein